MVKKRVFLCDFSSPLARDAALELTRRGAEILYWTGSKEEFEKTARDARFAGVIFHNTYDAIRGIPAPGVDASKFPPAGAELAGRFLALESELLIMMNRADFVATPIAKRKQLYYRYLEYWHGVLSNLRPDAVIFIDVPHAVYNFAIYEIARTLGIKTVMFQLTRLPDRLLITSDFREGSRRVQDAVGAFEGKTVSLADLPLEFQNYWQEQFGAHADPTPFDKKELDEKARQGTSLVPPFKKIWKNVRSLTIARTAFGYVRALLNTEGRILSISDEPINFKHRRFLRKLMKIKKDWKSEYARLSRVPDLREPFVYVPLHYQPENSTSPVGGMFVDQIQMIKILAAALPDGWRLLVKEHTSQWNPVDPKVHLGRYDAYYRDLARIPGVMLISADISSFEIIPKCKAVATVTGTAGWEGIMRGKPAVIFGTAWYTHAPGVFRVDGVETCRTAFEAIRAGARPTEPEVFRYLAAMDRACVKGYQQMTVYQKVSKVPYNENIKNLTSAIMEEI